MIAFGSQVQARIGASAAASVPAVGGTKTLDDVLREAAGDAGLGGMSFGGNLTLVDLMAQLTSAAECEAVQGT